ncbi:MAG: universal stress protein [Thermodesulfobacteriota bacterium]
MKRFKKILFVYDPDSEKGPAFERARELAAENKAELMIFQVLEEYPMAAQMMALSSVEGNFEKEILSKAYNALEEIASPLKAEGIKASVKVVTGVPFLEIIQEVLQTGHDLVMVTPRIQGRLKDILFGSRIMHLMRKCPCPVWAFNPQQRKRYDRIMAAVDVAPPDERGHSLNMSIMEMASSLAEIEECELHVIHCWQAYHEGTLRYRSGLKQEQVDDIIKETRKTHKEQTRALVEKFPLKKGTLSLHVVEGDPEEKIPEEAQKRRIDLVVMGTVIRTGLSGFFIGNTAEKVLRDLDCSVLAIKPEGFESPVTLD